MNALSSLVDHPSKHFLQTLLCVMVLTSGCSSVTVQGPSSKKALEIDAVVVNPIALRIADTKAWERYEKTRDIISVMEKQTQLDVVAPWEFDQIRPAQEPADYLQQSSLAPRTARMNIPTQRLLVLESVVEDESADRAAEVEFKGKRRRHRTYNSRIHVQVRLVHPSSNRVLLERTQSVVEDRFEATPEYDTRPTIRRTLHTTVRLLLAKAIDQGLIVPSAPLPARAKALPLRENPVVVLDHRGKGPTLRTVLKEKEPILREAAMFARMRYLDPKLTSSDFRLFLSLPSGLLVGAPAPAPLQPGDVITHIGETRVQWRFQWVRALRRTEAPLLLRIHRDGKPLMVTLPQP